MLKKLFAGAAVASLLAATPASAATYVSYLEYWDDEGIPGAQLVDDPFGYVQLEESLDGKTVTVTAYLYDGAKWQQSGGNNIFAFNLADDGETAISDAYVTPDVIHSTADYDHPPFGTFTDHFYTVKSGKNGRLDGPFTFTAFNDNGITFAGVGAEFDLNGLLTKTGSGNRFTSNAPQQNSIGGWWFMGHIQPAGENAASINIAARDAFCISGCPTTVVPEPDSWALMILGFGGAGYMIRRRKTVFA